MTRFEELLRQNQEAIIRRWLELALSSYAVEASAAFARQSDPFANPVGHGLREGTRGVFQALVADESPERCQQHLEATIRIRAVQAFSASQAIGFIFALKAAVRETLGPQANEVQFAAELARLDARVDGIALAAFDVFVECREQICQLRANEATRRYSWLANKMSQQGLQPDAVCGGATSNTCHDPGVQTGLKR